MQFNIVLFHIGEKYITNEIYKVCYNSVLKEFPEDNIIVFHSLEEIYEMFPPFKKDFLSHNKFFKKFNNDLYYMCDLARLLLTKYINNMIFMDADMYCHKGCREHIINHINDQKALIYFHCGWGIFYSKNYSKKLNEWIETVLTNDIRYNSDWELIQKSPHFYNDEICNADFLFRVSHIYNCKWLVDPNAQLETIYLLKTDDKKIFKQLLLKLYKSNSKFGVFYQKNLYYVLPTGYFLCYEDISLDFLNLIINCLNTQRKNPIKIVNCDNIENLPKYAFLKNIKKLYIVNNNLDITTKINTLCYQEDVAYFCQDNLYYGGGENNQYLCLKTPPFKEISSKDILKLITENNSIECIIINTLESLDYYNYQTIVSISAELESLKEENKLLKGKITTIGVEKTYLSHVANTLKAENEKLRAKLLALKN